MLPKLTVLSRFLDNREPRPSRGHMFREARREIHRLGIPPRQDAALRREQELVERSPADELKEVHACGEFTC